MTDIYDTDGQLLVRDRDGDLRPVHEPDDVPALRPGQVCAERDHPRADAERCPACWSEIHAGDRPRRLLGRQMDQNR